MTLLRKINVLAQKVTGFQLVRATKTQLLSIPKEQEYPSVVVEFMGPSGVGKTTLRNHYLKTHTTSLREPVLTEKALKNYQLDLKTLENPLFTFYNELFSIKLARMGEEKDDLLRSERRFKLFHKTLIDDCKIRFFLPQGFFFIDQHVFKFFTEDFFRTKQSPERNAFLKNRVVVYCHASPQTIVEYIRKRAKAGEVRIGHKGKTEEELLLQLKSYIDQWEKEVQLLRDEGVTVISINTENDLDVNAKTLHQYLLKYQQTS